MSFSFTIPKYTSKDFPILVATMFPMSMVLNYILWGSQYFLDPEYLVWATLVSFILLGGAYILYGWVAILFRSRFPHDHQSLKRMSMVIPIFILMSALFISLMLRGFELFGFLGYEYSDNDYFRAFATFVIVNIFLTFLNEGVMRFENYKATVQETEQLKKEYMQSQLMGLKSQMNPHFLFNSLNTLSCLIHENADQAEDFLDHMSKVYRYLLRNNDEKLVTLETELSFIKSYYYLLKSRYNEGLQLKIDVDAVYKNYMIPPLTLQMILENVLTHNTISRDHPLLARITIGENNLEFRNSVQPKMNINEENEALENISNKFRLLCQQEISVVNEGFQRIIRLPLITKEEVEL